MADQGTGRGRVLRVAGIGAGTVAFAIGFYFFVWTKPYQVPSESMKPTYVQSDIVRINRFFPDQTPEVGDVVLFHPAGIADRGDSCIVKPDPRAACAEPDPRLSNQTFIQRVVAVGGDSLKIEAGVAVVNGEMVEGDWETLPCERGPVCDLPAEIEIPADHYFLMGDNSGGASDSRFWGPVPQEAMIGVVND